MLCLYYISLMDIWLLWCSYNIIIYFSPVAQQPKAGRGRLIVQVGRSQTMTHRSWQDFSGRGIGLSERPLPDNTQQSQGTDFHAPGGIRIRNPSRRSAADPRLRPLYHWHRHHVILHIENGKLLQALVHAYNQKYCLWWNTKYTNTNNV